MNENNLIVEKKKSNKSLFIIIILVVMLLCSILYILYDKGIIFDNNSDKNVSCNCNKESDKQKINNENDNVKKDDNSKKNFYVNSKGEIIGIYAVASKFNTDYDDGAYDYSMLIFGGEKVKYIESIGRGSSSGAYGPYKYENNKIYIYDQECNPEMLVDATCDDPYVVLDVDDNGIKYIDNIYYQNLNYSIN